MLFLTPTIFLILSLPYSSHSGYFSEGCPCDSVVRKGKYVSRSCYINYFIFTLSMCPPKVSSHRRCQKTSQINFSAPDGSSNNRPIAELYNCQINILSKTSVGSPVHLKSAHLHFSSINVICVVECVATSMCKQFSQTIFSLENRLVKIADCV